MNTTEQPDSEKSLEQRFITEASYDDKADRYNKEKPRQPRLEFAHTVLSELPTPPVGIIVDVAAGKGEVANYLESKFNRTVTRFDLSINALSFHENNAAKADALHIPLAAECAGLIIVKDAIEHFPNLEDFLRECQRVLKPGGWVMIVSQTIRNSFFTFSEKPPKSTFRVAINDWKDYVELVDSYLAKYPQGKANAPYFKVNKDLVINEAAQYNLRPLQLQKSSGGDFFSTWTPSDESDWHELQRFIVTLQKPI